MGMPITTTMSTIDYKADTPRKRRHENNYPQPPCDCPRSRPVH